MPDSFNTRVVAGFRLFAWLAGLGAVALGALVLAGWLAGSRALETIRPGLAAMSPLTAVAFTIAGTSLLARQSARDRTARIAALLLLALCAAILASYLTLGRDALNPLLETASPTGLTAPATALAFTLLGATLLSLGKRGTEPPRALVLLAGPGLLLSALAVLGYAYGVEGIYAVPFFHTVALHTAVGLFALFLACLVTEPERGWAAIVSSGLASGAATRGQLLLATVAPFLIGLLVLRAIKTGFFAPSLAIAILVSSTMVPLILRVLVDGRTLDRLDMQRAAAVRAQAQLTDTLEERVRARTASLALSEARQRTFFDHATEGLALLRITPEGYVFDAVNPAYRAIYGIGDRPIIGLTPQQWFDAPTAEEVLDHLARSAATQEAHRYTTRRTVAGEPRTFNVTLAPVPATQDSTERFVIGNVRDVTEAELREEQLRQAQKMEAVGQLTGGLAHDFNNLLTAIGGSLELMSARIAQGRTNDIERYVGAAQGAAKRAAALTHRLLAFSRRQTLDPQLTDVDRLVTDMAELIRRTVGPAVEVEVVGTAGLWPTLVDPNQLEGALLNLCINARDAMPEGGRLTIETANKFLDGRSGRERDLAPGQYLSLCVTDTGTGMTPDIARRAFDPFFTTKPTGMGTGLGLSMVYGFARQSGGQARIYSEPGQGSTVCLYLPRHYGEHEQHEDAAEPLDIPRAEEGETVLVVDDEPTVRMLVTDILHELGYAALEAENGEGGLKVLRSDARIDLLVTDVGLPGGMNGRQMADAAREVRPKLKVLFITGYAENAAVGNGHLEAGMHVLTKPFAMETLGSRIKDLIVGV